jgi:hypothetical protein
VTVSGFTGTSYPDDVPGQNAIYKALLDPVVTLLLGAGVEYDLFTRRGAIRRGTLPPVEVDLRLPNLALKFRMEGARLSRAKQQGLGHLFFNPTVCLATRWDTDGVTLSIFH